MSLASGGRSPMTAGAMRPDLGGVGGMPYDAGCFEICFRAASSPASSLESIEERPAGILTSAPRTR
jgi:hypothetical protein